MKKLVVILVLFGVIVLGFYFYKDYFLGSKLRVLKNDRNLPHGLIAVKEYKSNKGKSFAEATYKNSFVSGMALRIGWRDLNPEKDQYSWSVLDELFAKSQANNKFVVLILVPGFETPDWVMAEISQQGFSRKYGKGVSNEGILPLPWDEVYLKNWFEFLGKISQRYAGRAEFRMISLAGPTSLSAEMSLPNLSEDLSVWQELGYRPAKYLDAWKQVFANYSRSFPDQYLSLALYPGLPINETGEIDESEKEKTRQAVIDIGLNNYGDRFSLQTSGLHAGGEGAGGYEIVRNYSGKIITGFQLSTSATRNPGKLGDSQDPSHALKLTLEKGLVPNGQGQIINYFEIYEPDILNPSMQAVLEEISRKLN